MARPKSTSEQVVSAIVTKIRTERLRPGDRLGSSTLLAREFGVSRPTLVDAIRQLASANLVRTAKGPGGGYFVSDVNPDTAHPPAVPDQEAPRLSDYSLGELLEAQLMLEAPLAGLVAHRATEQDIADLSSILAEENGRTPSVAVVGARLHLLIARVSGNAFAADMLGWLVQRVLPEVDRHIGGAVIEVVVEEHHRRIIDAIADHDPRSAATAMRDLLVYVQDVLVAVGSDEHPFSDGVYPLFSD